MKIKKLATRITVFVVIATALGMFIQSAITSYYMRGIMQDEAKSKLENMVNSTALEIGMYIDRQYAYLDGFMATDEMQAIVDNPMDEEVRAASQAYTKHYTDVIPNAKSLFYTEYTGSVLTHTNAELIGYKNDADIISMIQNLYFNPEGKTVYNIVAAVSPATNEIGLIIARSSYSNGKPAGYASIELAKEEFYAILENAVKITDNQEVVLTGVNNPVVYYSTNPDEITLESTNPAILELSKQVAGTGTDSTGFINYRQAGTNKPMLGYYTYMAEKDWLLFVAADLGQFNSIAFSSMNKIVILALIMITIIAVLLSIMINTLIKPITSVQKALSKVAKHDLTRNEELEKLIKRPDEIGKLATGTNEVVSTLNEVLDLFKDCSNDLNDSATNLNGASDLLTDVTSDNKDIADNLSVKINDTTDAIENINTEIENIVQYMNDVSDKVNSGQKESQTLIDSASDMNVKIDAEIEKNMATLQQTMSNMQEALESLKAVEQINALSEDIMSIASQTNLLSLNASIEAARAGEAGRGFAVVADEIGQLADQSKSTAMDITQIVAASNNSVTNVREQVAILIEYIKNDVIASFEMFATQSKYYDEGISKVRDGVSEIGSAVNSLSDSVNEIANQIKAVNDASLENTDGVANILGKNEQTGEVTESIKDLAETSASNAKQLKDAIEKFTTD